MAADQVNLDDDGELDGLPSRAEVIDRLDNLWAPPRPAVAIAAPSVDGQGVDMVELTRRLQAGEEIDLKSLCRDPEQFEHLEALLPTLRSVVDLAQGLAGEAAGGGSCLGDFRIVRELGRGGMGVVYEAEQISLGRRVALKVLPLAAILDKQQLTRFKNEARAAATLEHPNIVAIYSVGAERGVHYYAMQLIEGQSLAEMVDELRAKSGELRGGKRGQNSFSTPTSEFVETQESKKSSDPFFPEELSALSSPPSASDTVPVASLSTLPAFDSREYLRTVARLGIQAAQALDHAHQNGILHRDVKPGNLLLE